MYCIWRSEGMASSPYHSMGYWGSNPPWSLVQKVRIARQESGKAYQSYTPFSYSLFGGAILRQPESWVRTLFEMLFSFQSEIITPVAYCARSTSYLTRSCSSSYTQKVFALVLRVSTSFSYIIRALPNSTLVIKFCFSWCEMSWF